MTHPLSEAGTSVEVKPWPSSPTPAEAARNLRDYAAKQRRLHGTCPPGDNLFEDAARIIDALIQPTPAETEGGELVGRLREVHRFLTLDWQTGIAREMGRTANEAADRIESLSRHLEEAREALKPFGAIPMPEAPPDFSTIRDMGASFPDEIMELEPAHFRAARRAKETVSHG